MPRALADAPWLVRKFTLAHVPAPSNFVSLRKIATGSRASHPWFGFGDFRPVTLAQAEKTFSGPGCGESAKLLAGLPPLPYARKELEAARALLGADASDELLGPGVHRRCGAEDEAEGLPHPAVLHPRLAARRTALPERAGDRHIGAAKCDRCIRRAADRVGGCGPRSGRRPGDPVGLQLGRSRRHHGGRKPVRPGARVLLCRRAVARGDALVGQ